MTFLPDEIKNLLHTHYKITADIYQLNGYDEENYLVKTSNGDRYILKIASVQEHGYSLPGQIAMMDHLSAAFPEGNFQQVIAPVVSHHDQYKIANHHSDMGSKKLVSITKNEKSYTARLLSFLKGRFWYETPVKTPSLYESLGSFLGQMDLALSDFSHPGLHRHITWDVSKAADATGKLKFITDPAKRRIADYFLLQFQTEVTPFISSLRHAYVHNDANDYNVLTSDEEVTGLIDFGDSVYTALINNLAIASTYAILYDDDPLKSVCHILRGYHEKYPLLSEEIDILYYLISARLCISVTQSAFNASGNSDNEHHFLSEKPAWDLLEKWIRINPVKAADAFRQVCGFENPIDQSDGYDELLKDRFHLIGRNLSISYKKPLKIVKGALQYLYDDKGKTFVDCVNNVSHVGHCHPTVVRAMQKQLATLNTNTRYLNDNIIAYAKALTAKLPSRLKVCYFVNSGSEANDLAIRMARHFTDRQDVIVLDHAYHGTSTLAIEMSPYKFDSKGGSGKKPYIHKAISPDLYRGIYQYDDENAGSKYADSVRLLLDDLLKKGTPASAFICETLLGVGGQIPLPEGYLKAVYEHVRNYGGICIADEVQVGFGRVGEKFWGFELQAAEPDIVVMGKPMGNGHPLAAVVVTEEIANAFNNGLEYFNTYGGNPVSMTTGMAVLNVIEKERLQQNALVVGNHLMALLKKLMIDYPIIGDVRGHGLFIGAEMVKDRITKEPALPEIDLIIEKMKERGFLLSTDGPLHNVLKIKPPIVFSIQNAEDLVRELDSVLSELCI